MASLDRAGHETGESQSSEVNALVKATQAALARRVVRSDRSANSAEYLESAVRREALACRALESLEWLRRTLGPGQARASAGRPGKQSKYIPGERPAVFEPLPQRVITFERQDIEPPGPGDYGRMLWRYKLVIAGLTAGLAAIGLLIALPQRPLYQAHTSIEVQGPNENFLNLKDLVPGSAATQSSADTYVETQARLLRDESLMEKAIHQLGLASRPYVLVKPGLLSEILEAAGIHRPKPALAHDELIRQASANLNVQVSAQSRIIDINFDSVDPQTAANVSNAIANGLIDQNLEVRSRTVKRLSESLSEELQGLRANYERSARELQDYARSTGLIVNESGGGSFSENRLKQVQEEYLRAQADRVARQSRYEQAATAAPETLPDVLDNPTLRDYKTKLTELWRQMAELNTAFLPAFPKVKTLKAQITELEGIFEKERAAIVKRLRNEYEAAERREKMLAQSYAGDSKVVTDEAGRSIHYNVLKREVESNRLLYESILQKVKEADVASAIRASNMRIISPAKRPSRPYMPNPARNAFMGAIAGLFFSLAFAFIREHTDKTLKRPGDAAAFLNVPEIGAIPSAHGALHRLGPPARDGRRRPRFEMASWIQQSSVVAESFRDALASLCFLCENGRLPCIAVSSPGAGEGKTSLISNLGIALANTKRRVLLVDADLRRPRLHDLFGLANDWGLGNLLEAQMPVKNYPLDSLVFTTEVPDLFVMPAGERASNIAGMRYHGRLAELMQRMRSEFDAVLVDTPPVLGFSDARLVARLTDGVVLVVRSAETTRNDAAAAVRRLQQDGTSVLGVILNDWDRNQYKYGYAGPRSA